MKLEIPYKIRATLYILLMIGGPLLIALNSWGLVDAIGVNLWLGISSAIALIAQLNISKGDDNGTVK